jgi:outer membrane protein OmpA-like peptidoglycan-associated protein
MNAARLLRSPATVGLILAAGVALSGCATTDFVKKQIAGEDEKLQATQQQVNSQNDRLQAHDARLGEVDKTAREALDRAQAAGKLAEGKFMYSVVLSDDSVKFPVSGSELSEEAKSRLLDFAQKLKTENKNVYLEIQGYTDNRGPKANNKRLGLERAEAVRLFLNQQGVPLNRIATISYGPDNPVADNKSKTGRAQNRRVVIIVLN